MLIFHRKLDKKFNISRPFCVGFAVPCNKTVLLTLSTCYNSIRQPQNQTISVIYRMHQEYSNGHLQKKSASCKKRARKATYRIYNKHFFQTVNAEKR